MPKKRKLVVEPPRPFDKDTAKAWERPPTCRVQTGWDDTDPVYCGNPTAVVINDQEYCRCCAKDKLRRLRKGIARLEAACLKVERILRKRGKP